MLCTLKVRTLAVKARVFCSGEEVSNHGGYCVGDESVVDSGDNCIK